MTLDRAKRTRILVAAAVFAGLVGVGVAGRLLDHTPNVTPVAAAALFAAFFFANRWVALAVPMLIMAISDAFVGTSQLPIMIAVYVGFAFPIVWRGLLKRRLSVLRVTGCALSGAVFFSIVSNAAVWWMWYDHTIAGATTCFMAALPFFRSTLMGDLAWSVAFFGAYQAVVEVRRSRLGLQLSIPRTIRA